MQEENKPKEEETHEEVQNGTFGYTSSVVFLIFIGFVIYISVSR